MIEIDSKLLTLDNLSLFKIFRFEEDKFHTEFDTNINSVDMKIKSRIRLKNKKFPAGFPNMKTFNVCENIEIYSSIQNNSAKNLFCPICLDLMIFPVLINCGHSYCRVCIYEFSNNYDNCLLCPGLINQSKYLQNKILSKAILKYVKRNLPNRLQARYASRLKKHKVYLLKRKYRVDDSKLGEIVNIRQIDFRWEKGVINKVERFKNVTVGRVLLIKDYEKQVHSNSIERYVNLESDDVISV
jgi:hypothetical protein